MQPVTFDAQGTALLISFCSLAFVSLNFYFTRRGANEESAKRHAITNAKLDNNCEQTREVLASIKELNKAMNDHSQLLARHSEQIGTLFRRTERIESVLDVQYRAAAKEGIDGKQ